MSTIVTVSGRTKQLPADLAAERVAGLDADGRIVVDDFDARNPESKGITYTDWNGEPRTDPPFMFGLTLCCNASDKGVEDGIVCRACYSYSETGNYIHRAEDGSFPGLDPVKEIRA